MILRPCVTAELVTDMPAHLPLPVAVVLLQCASGRPRAPSRILAPLLLLTTCEYQPQVTKQTHCDWMPRCIACLLCWGACSFS
jgi:hypothetical protein